MRAGADEIEALYGEAWADIVRTWEQYQLELGMPEDERGALFGPFRNPYQRVQQQGDLATYARNAAAGKYGELALSEACYVAPTQASVTPDGLQFRCGAHAVRRTQPIGNILDGDLTENIRRGIDGMRCLPDPALCNSCALATVYINQSVERKLSDKVAALLAEAF